MLYTNIFLDFTSLLHHILILDFFMHWYPLKMIVYVLIFV